MSAASTTTASGSSRTRPPTRRRLSPSRSPTACSPPSGRRSGSGLVRLSPRQLARRERVERVELDRALEGRDRPAVVPLALLEAPELPPRPPVQRLQLDRVDVALPRALGVAELLQRLGLDEQW